MAKADELRDRLEVVETNGKQARQRAQEADEARKAKGACAAQDSGAGRGRNKKPERVYANTIADAVAGAATRGRRAAGVE
jgi:hypothetical protein